MHDVHLFKLSGKQLQVEARYSTKEDIAFFENFLSSSYCYALLRQTLNKLLVSIWAGGRLWMSFLNIFKTERRRSDVAFWAIFSRDILSQITSQNFTDRGWQMRV